MSEQNKLTNKEVKSNAYMCACRCGINVTTEKW